MILHRCHCSSRQRAHILSPLLLAISFFILVLQSNPTLVASSAEPVFIATRNGAKSSSKSKQNNIDSTPQKAKVKMSHSFDVSTASDAALALNSVQFMEMLIGTKNSADINTYTQKYSPLSATHNGRNEAEKTIEISPKMKDNTPPEPSSWNFASKFFGRRGNIHVEAGTIPPALHVHGGEHSSNHNCLSDTSLTKSNNQSCPTHETVSEYVGRLWFLPESKGGIKFRETVRVISLSADGKSSTLECNTQYHNGSKWVDCSKIICTFLSIPSIPGDGDEVGLLKRGMQSGGHKSGEMNVTMTLDCELLVWLPLPKAATKAVQRKISSVFEAVALDYFEVLASN